MYRCWGSGRSPVWWEPGAADSSGGGGDPTSSGRQSTSFCTCGPRTGWRPGRLTNRQAAFDPLHHRPSEYNLKCLRSTPRDVVSHGDCHRCGDGDVHRFGNYPLCTLPFCAIAPGQKRPSSGGGSDGECTTRFARHLRTLPTKPKRHPPTSPACRHELRKVSETLVWPRHGTQSAVCCSPNNILLRIILPPHVTPHPTAPTPLPRPGGQMHGV